MGGRGSIGGGGGETVSVNGRKMSITRFLSQQDINRANAASVMAIGDNIKSTFAKNVEEINKMDLSDAEKQAAVDHLAGLSTTALHSAAGAVNPYVSGRARLSRTQMSGSAADRAVQDRAQISSYMNSLRSQAASNRRSSAARSLTEAMQGAVSSGALVVTVNGRTYRRANRRSNTWRPD